MRVGSDVCLYRLRNVAAPAYAEDTLESPCVTNPRKDYCFTFKISHKEKSVERSRLYWFCCHRLNRCVKTHKDVNILISSIFFVCGGGKLYSSGNLVSSKGSAR